MIISGRALVEGNATGQVLFSNTPLSFWGGTDPASGTIVDAHHPLCGSSLQGRILAIPCGRGSCTGSGAMLEMMLNGNAPAALVFSFQEEIITAGIIIAKVLFGKQIPVVLLTEELFALLEHAPYATIHNGEVKIGQLPSAIETCTANGVHQSHDDVSLTPKDRDMLNGKHGKAAAAAIRILLDFAMVQKATELIDVSQSHLDSVLYTGPASLLFPNYMQKLGDAKFAVPTSMNSISIDQQRWKALGVDREFADKANRLAETYVAMGAKPTYTCAPYLLDTKPRSGEHIGWAESNAVVFANSVLGAFTQKYPDMIDVCIAITGRAPLAGAHTANGRAPSIAIQIPACSHAEDTFWPVLGYTVGQISGNNIPLVMGLEFSRPSISDLKAFGAAFATTSSAPLFHIRGVTPSHVIQRPGMTKHTISTKDLLATWKSLNTAKDSSVAVVALGNPHFSLDEFERLAYVIKPTRLQKSGSVQMMITTNRDVFQKISSSGVLDRLQAFGAQIVTDTCWCMIEEPVIRVSSGGNIMTNSAKYAHYAPGIVRRKVHFGSLEECVNASVTGYRASSLPAWLNDS